MTDRVLITRLATPQPRPPTPASSNPTPPQDAVRISRYLNHVERSLLQQTRWLGAGWMGGVIGTLLGTSLLPSSVPSVALTAVGAGSGLLVEGLLSRRLASWAGRRLKKLGAKIGIKPTPKNEIEAGSWWALIGMGGLTARLLTSLKAGTFENLVPGSHAAGQTRSVADTLGNIFHNQVANEAGSVVDHAQQLVNRFNLGTSLIGPLLMYQGAAGVERGLADGDTARCVDGKMRLAAGFLSFTQAGVAAGLALSAIQWAVGRRVRKGKMTLEQADKLASRSLATAIGPAGLATHALLTELKRRGVEPHGAAPIQEVKITAPELILSVGANLVGGLAGYAFGAAAGGAIGGPIGATVGAALGNMAGVGVSMSVCALIQGVKFRHKGLLTGEDARLLGRVAGGAFIGGIGGWVVGISLGTALGAGAVALVGPGIGTAMLTVLGQTGATYLLAGLGARKGARLMHEEQPAQPAPPGDPTNRLTSQSSAEISANTPPAPSG